MRGYDFLVFVASLGVGMLTVLAGSVGAAPIVVGVSDDDASSLVASVGTQGCLVYVRDVWGCESWHDIYGNPVTWTNDVLQMLTSPDGAVLYVLGHSGYPNHETFLRSLDAATGQPIWSVALGKYGGLTELNTMALDSTGSHILVGGMWDPDNDWRTPSKTSVVLSFEAATGSLAWRVDWGGPQGQFNAGTSIALHPDGSIVYLVGTTRAVCSDGDICGGLAIAAYSVFDGSILYQRVQPIETYPFFVIKNVAFEPAANRLVAVASAGPAVVWSLDAADGDILWSTELPQSFSFTIAGPVINDASGLVHVALAPGTVAALHSAGGSVAWLDETPTVLGPLSLSPDGGTLFSLGGQGQVLAYDAADGSILWQRPPKVPYQFLGVAADPSGQRVYLAGCEEVSEGRALTVAVDAATGTDIWAAAFQHEPAHPLATRAICGAQLHVGDGAVFAAGSTMGTNSSNLNGFHRDSFVVAYPIDPVPHVAAMPDLSAECMYKEDGRDKTQCAVAVEELAAECQVRDPVSLEVRCPTG